jgi:hypothetical protein
LKGKNYSKEEDLAENGVIPSMKQNTSKISNIDL